jgi:peptide deformylase
MIKQAVQVGNPIVRKQSKPVRDPKAPNVRKLVRDLADSMRHYGLVGMAAPQIGVNLRVYVSEIRKTKNRNPVALDPLRVFINPIITKKSTTQTVLYEGCGSLDFGHIFGPVKRASTVEVAACDEYGKKFTFTARGLLAKVMQHEIDHLDGILCLDRFTDSRKVMHVDEYRKWQTVKKR